MPCVKIFANSSASIVQKAAVACNIYTPLKITLPPKTMFINITAFVASHDMPALDIAIASTANACSRCPILFKSKFEPSTCRTVPLGRTKILSNDADLIMPPNTSKPRAKQVEMAKQEPTAA